MTQLTAGCTHDDRDTFLDLGVTPLADSFTTSPNELQPYYPLRAEYCTSCYLVELSEDSRAPDDQLFGDDYAFFSGSSPALVRHLTDYARWIKTYFAEFDEVVEVACNDGTMLNLLHGCAPVVRGIDPAGPPTQVAREMGLDVETGYFTEHWARDYVGTTQARRLVIANNVVAHVPDVRDFLAGLVVMLAHDGVAVLEFQYLADLLLGNQFDLVYHEHRRFLSFTALVPLLAEVGLVITRFDSIDTQGGSARVVVRPAGADEDLGEFVQRMERWLQSPDVYTSFAGRVVRIAEKLNELVALERASGRTVALYGAPAKATTLLHEALLTTGSLEYAVDLTPYKIGRYLPGTDVQVITPTEESQRDRADTYLLAIPNYLGSIVRREAAFLGAGGRFIIPLPRPVVL